MQVLWKQKFFFYRAIIFNPKSNKFIGDVLYDIDGENYKDKFKLRIEEKKIFFIGPNNQQSP